MLRALIVVAIVTGLLFAPGAAAARASLAIGAPTTMDATGGQASADIHVLLRVQGFACTSESTFTVRLLSPTEGPLKASIPYEVLLHVPPGEYLNSVWEGQATVPLEVSAQGAGDVLVLARLETGGEGCVAPSGYTHERSGVRIRVHYDAPPEPASPTPLPPPQEAPPEPEPTPEPEPAPAAPTTCSPSVTCGYIGEFTPGESQTSKPVPGAGVVLALAALGLALVLRRRR